MKPSAVCELTLHQLSFYMTELPTLVAGGMGGTGKPKSKDPIKSFVLENLGSIDPGADGLNQQRIHDRLFKSQSKKLR